MNKISINLTHELPVNTPYGQALDTFIPILADHLRSLGFSASADTSDTGLVLTLRHAGHCITIYAEHSQDLYYNDYQLAFISDAYGNTSSAPIKISFMRTSGGLTDSKTVLCYGSICYDDNNFAFIQPLRRATHSFALCTGRSISSGKGLPVLLGGDSACTPFAQVNSGNYVSQPTYVSTIDTVLFERVYMALGVVIPTILDSQARGIENAIGTEVRIAGQSYIHYAAYVLLKL